MAIDLLAAFIIANVTALVVFLVMRSIAARQLAETHAALLERVWGKAHRGDVEYLRVAVRALRLKIEDDPSQPVLIRNEPGIGYRLG